MFGPVVCFSCNRRLATVFERVRADVNLGQTHEHGLCNSGLHPVHDMCCRRMIMCAIDAFGTLSVHDDRQQHMPNVTSFRFSQIERKLDCV